MRSAGFLLLFLLCTTGYPTSAVATSTCEDFGLTNCDGICVDTSRDNSHCGWCNQSCDVANHFQCCNGACTDLAGDPQNCGSCGAVCQDFEPCYAIACVDGLCTPGQTDKDSDGDAYLDADCPGGTDCDDDNPDVNPGSTEGPGGDATCVDGRDNDCDNLTDYSDPGCCWCSVNEDCDDGNTCTWNTCNGCRCFTTPLPYGWTCDDYDPCTMTEYCVGGVCTEGIVTDVDGDTFAPESCGGSDCDDSDAGVNPAAEEFCGDGVDQDCNGMDLQCGCPDADGDGFPDGACGGSDCDDANADNNPDADEVCEDGTDNDCDGHTDTDDAECPECLAHEECDDGNFCNGFERCIATACEPGTPPDCDDGNICTDDNCDPADGCKYAYNTMPCETWIYCRPGYCQEGICVHGEPRDCSYLDDICYLGRCDDTLDSCIAEQVLDGVDCDDEDPCTMNEVCVDGVCTWGTPLDEDQDGFVSPDCGGADCDDSHPGIHPGALDLCDDGIDQDCNGSDLRCDCLDSDDDGYADEACGGRDCDDEDADVNPEADEVCNDEVDNDCDGITDNMGTVTCGLGPCRVTVEVCVEGVLQECVPLQPEEFMERSCTDGIDNDCDGNIDYDDLNCLGRTDAGDWWNDRQVTGGGCGCGATGTGGLGLFLVMLGLIVGRRNL